MVRFGRATDQPLHRLLYRSLRWLARQATLSSSLFAVIARASLAQPAPPEAIDRRKLAADTVVNGVPCARSNKAPAEFHKANGRLASCELSRAFEVSAHAFPAATWLDFNASGTLWGAWLSHNTALDHHTCLGTGYKAWSVRFHPNGKLAGCYLAADTVIAGVPCMRGSFLREVRGGSRTALQLDSAGRVRRCQAARDTIAEGRRIRKWDVVTW